MLGAASCILIDVHPVNSAQARFHSEIALFTGGAPEIQGVLGVEIPAVAESGYTVPVRVKVTESDLVIDRLRVLAPANPLVRIAAFDFGPMAQPVDVSFRIRLARSQPVTVLARAGDGRILRSDVQVDVVTGGCGFDLPAAP